MTGLKITVLLLVLVQIAAFDENHADNGPTNRFLRTATELLINSVENIELSVISPSIVPTTKPSTTQPTTRSPTTSRNPTTTPTRFPTVMPSTVAPTISPSSRAPTTSNPTTQGTCPFYSVTGTNSATVNAGTCSFIACGGTTIVASGCGSCIGDQYLQLRSMSGVVLLNNDDGCGTSGGCAILSYIVPGANTACATYTLNEGCYQAQSCSGTVTVTGVSAIVPTPTAMPTSTTAPSKSTIPTVLPSSSKIPTTAMPTSTTAPSSKSTIPTILPSLSKIPTARPTTRVPTPLPSTKSPTALPTSPFNTTHGIVSGKSIAELTSEGYTVCYDQPYSTATTSSALLAACNTETNAMLFVGSKSTSSDTTLSLGAYGLASDVFSPTYNTSTAVLKNGVYWYFYVAFGFADSSYIILNQADTYSPSAFRLSWLLNVVSGGGYRSGNTLGLTYDSTWRKVIYKRPADWVVGTPSKQPTLVPSKVPTRFPTFSIPSITPTRIPTVGPTQRPSTRGPTVPAGSPSRLPTQSTQTPLSPTRSPTGRPSFAPSVGVTWVQSVTSPVTTWLSLASSSTGKYLTATTSALGLYYSVNYGASWAKSDAPKCTYSSVTSTESGQISIAVCSGSVVGAYMSSNYGRNWTAMSYTVSGSRRISEELEEIRPAAVPSGIVLTSVVISTSGVYIYGVTSTGGLMTSSNSGSSFTLRTSPGFTASKIFADRSGAYVIVIDTAGCAWSSSTFSQTFVKNIVECVGYNAVTIAYPYVVLAYASTGYVKQTSGFGPIWNTYSVSTLNTNIVTDMAVDSSGMRVAAITSGLSDCIHISTTYGTSWSCYTSSPLAQWTTISMDISGSSIVAGGQSTRLYAMTVTDSSNDDGASSQGSSFDWNSGAGSGVVAAIVVVAFIAIFVACYYSLRLDCCRPVSPDAGLVANTGHTEVGADESGDFALATAISEHDVESLRFASGQGGKGGGVGSGGREMFIGEYITPSAPPPPQQQQYGALAVDDVEVHQTYDNEYASPQPAVVVDQSSSQVYYDLPEVPTKPVVVAVVPAVLVQEQTPYIMEQDTVDKGTSCDDSSSNSTDEQALQSTYNSHEDALDHIESPIEAEACMTSTQQQEPESEPTDVESHNVSLEESDLTEPEQVNPSQSSAQIQQQEEQDTSPELEVPPVHVLEEAVVLLLSDHESSEEEVCGVNEVEEQSEVKTFSYTSHNEVVVVGDEEEKEEVVDYSNM